MRTAPSLVSGRIEHYEVRSLPTTPVQIGFPCIYKIIQIKRTSTGKKRAKDKVDHGTSPNYCGRLFLCSDINLNPMEALRRVRSRWSVENKNHHPRDATWHEDKCRARTGNTAANLALLRGVVLSHWKRNHPEWPAPVYIKYNNSMKGTTSLLATLSD